MAFFENMPSTLRGVFDDGLDEILIFVIIFIFVLLAGRDTDELGEPRGAGGILPIIVIAGFLLLFIGICRNGEERLEDGA